VRRLIAFRHIDACRPQALVDVSSYPDDTDRVGLHPFCGNVPSFRRRVKCGKCGGKNVECARTEVATQISVVSREGDTLLTGAQNGTEELQDAGRDFLPRIVLDRPTRTACASWPSPQMWTAFRPRLASQVGPADS
jgi:hypothetical protein